MSSPPSLSSCYCTRTVPTVRLYRHQGPVLVQYSYVYHTGTTLMMGFSQQFLATVLYSILNHKCKTRLQYSTKVMDPPLQEQWHTSS